MGASALLCGPGEARRNQVCLLNEPFERAKGEVELPVQSLRLHKLSVCKVETSPVCEKTKGVEVDWSADWHDKNRILGEV